jgi:D-arabinose 1-dehydrogenase-like Zn-dependent alcohol dehydrogenase
MKVFVAGGTGAIGRPLIARLLANGHTVAALTRSQEKAQALVKPGIEPAVADVFDAKAVKSVVGRVQPEVIIEQLTALPRTYTRESRRGGRSEQSPALRRCCERPSRRASGWGAALPQAVGRVLGGSWSRIGR